MKVLVFVTLISLSFAWQSFAPGEGPFDNMSNEEFAAKYLMSAEYAPNEIPPRYDAAEFESVFGHNSTFDWRKTQLSHCVHPIRDQGKCGSCWAHATTEMMSDRHCIENHGKGHNLIFAPQYMVDCANKTWDASGCDGAETQIAIRWMTNFGMVNESCYPYHSGTTQKAGNCTMGTQCPSGEKWVTYKVNPNSVKLHFNYTNTEMARDIHEHGPIYFSMVVFDDFKAYKSGVYYPISYNVLGTHAVKCVGWGYDAEKHSHYWICANSWTTGWGEQGFFRIGFNNHIGYKAGSARGGHSEVENPFISI